MEYYLKQTFLISQFVMDKKKKKRALKLARTSAFSNDEILKFLKKEGCITLGKTKDDVLCFEPNDLEKIDELIYQYFMYREKKWKKYMM